MFWSCRYILNHVYFIFQRTEEALNSGEGLGGIQEESAAAEATLEEFAAIKAKKKSFWEEKEGNHSNTSCRFTILPYKNEFR